MFMERRFFLRLMAGVPFLGPLLFQAPEKLALLRQLSIKIASAPARLILSKATWQMKFEFWLYGDIKLRGH
jgi:hypothetical protein